MTTWAPALSLICFVVLVSSVLSAQAPRPYTFNDAYSAKLTGRNVGYQVHTGCPTFPPLNESFDYVGNWFIGSVSHSQSQNFRVLLDAAGKPQPFSVTFEPPAVPGAITTLTFSSNGVLSERTTSSVVNAGSLNLNAASLHEWTLDFRTGAFSLYDVYDSSWDCSDGTRIFNHKEHTITGTAEVPRVRTDDSSLSLSLSPTHIRPYIPSSGTITVPVRRARDVVVEATITPARAELVTFSIRPSDLRIGGHEHNNTSSPAINVFTFLNDSDQAIAPACTTDVSTGSCRVRLVTVGRQCLGTNMFGAGDAWCTVSGDYVLDGAVGALQSAPAILRVREPGLEAVPLHGDHYVTASCVPPSSCAGLHPQFNWATPIMRSKIICLANGYWAATRGSTLSFNDMSLPLGGLFDYRGNWGADHQFHRLGRSVDVNTTIRNADGQQVQLLPTDPTLNRIAEECDMFRVDEGATLIHFDLRAAVELP